MALLIANFLELNLEVPSEFFLGLEESFRKISQIFLFLWCPLYHRIVTQQTSAQAPQMTDGSNKNT